MVYDRGKPNFETIKLKFTYTDDITLYCNRNDIEEARSFLLDNEFNYITDWLACNKLSLNVDKTKSINNTSVEYIYKKYKSYVCRIYIQKV